MASFLLEIGTEEIPARMINSAVEELSRRLGELLAREHLVDQGSAGPLAPMEAFSTPRRIAVLAHGVAAAQPDVEEQVIGPSLKVAYKDGEPTPAAHAFARKVGLGLGALQRVSTAKGEYLAAKVVKKGRDTAALLAEALPKEIGSIYWAKNMYWRGKSAERFVRPVRWMMAMLDGKVVPVEFGGVTAGNRSRGHRILSHGDIILNSQKDYAERLRAACVIARQPEREALIRKALDAATRAIPGARWREDRELLATVVNLTEFPAAILGSFEAEYLSLPEEVLVTVMRDHQKYFAVEDTQGKLAPHFLAVLNTSGDPDGLIRHGNERVLRARFNDARFFWQTDQKIDLKQRVEMLRSVTFQKELGSYYEKTIRVQHLASLIGESVRQSGLALRPGIIHKAALLAKTDLTTELVKEFTELQGIIGGLYARAQAKTLEMDPVVGDVIYDHYRPKSMEDAVPRSRESAVLAIADKADSIAGMFALGFEPSGSKDPFALRRAGNGIVRILAEHNLPLSIRQIMDDAMLQYKGSEAEKKFTAADGFQRNVGGFFRERLEFYLREARGFAYDVVNAVLASGPDNVPDTLVRAEAVAKVRGSEDFEAISVAFKRIKNILRQAAEANKMGPSPAGAPSGKEEPAERELALQAAQSGEKVQALCAEKRYDEAMVEVARIRKPIDEFFDRVMVMVDEEEVRNRRLGLLSALLQQFNTIADFSEITPQQAQSERLPGATM
jgi:glycyl-tRNA synthetase beta chain